MSIFVFFVKLIVAAFICAVVVEISALLIGCLVLIRERRNRRADNGRLN